MIRFYDWRQNTLVRGQQESILNRPAKFLIVYNVHSLEVLCRALWEKDINDLSSSETCVLQDWPSRQDLQTGATVARMWSMSDWVSSLFHLNEFVVGPKLMSWQVRSPRQGYSYFAKWINLVKIYAYTYISVLLLTSTRKRFFVSFCLFCFVVGPGQCRKHTTV